MKPVVLVSAVALIDRDGRVLLAQRPEGKSMAGLWESWRPKDEEAQTTPLLSCTIITTDSNDFTRELHDRMPVILAADNWELWLDTSITDEHALQPLLCPFESDTMKMDAVSTHVNNARHEGPECVVVQRELF